MSMWGEFDERDQAILDERQKALDEVEHIRVGDYVRFADGKLRRAAYVWKDEHGAIMSVQTSDGGSYYLGTGYVSMSGGLYPGVKPETLTLTDETREGSVWFFHHDWHTAHNGIYTTAVFRVYDCEEVANA